jgi:hypothetical protein
MRKTVITRFNPYLLSLAAVYLTMKLMVELLRDAGLEQMPFR